MVGGRWRWQWARPHLAHVGGCEGDSGGSGGGDVSGGGGKNKRSDDVWQQVVAKHCNYY